MASEDVMKREQVQAVVFGLILLLMCVIVR